MSLGLVSYDSSGTEDSEDDEGVVQSNADAKLPAPQPERLNIGEQLKRALPPPKRRGNAIKIVAPALPELDSDEDEEPQPKKTKSGKNISSLFAMLPKPKHTTVKQTNRILIPHTLTKKAPPPPRVPVHPRVTSKPPSNNDAGSNDDDDDDGGNFFALGISEKEDALSQVSSDVRGTGIGAGPSRPAEAHEGAEVQKPVSRSSLLSRLGSLPKKSDNLVTETKPQALRAEQPDKSSYTKLLAASSQSPLTGSCNTQSPLQTLPGHSRVGPTQLEPTVAGPARPKPSKLVSTPNSEQSIGEPSDVSRRKKNKLVSHSEPGTQRPQSKLVSTIPEAEPPARVQPELNEEPLSFSSTRTPLGYQSLQSSQGLGYPGTVDAQMAVEYGEPYQYGPHDTGNSNPATSSYGNGNPATSSYGGNSLLADEEFQKMIGREKFDPSLLIDVNADDHMGNVTAEEWALKGMTEEKEARQQLKKEQLPTGQQKRKHQITYLARQAKERELELKNSWANNRMTRKETQSKYGF